jgi:hypothetical protein
LPFSKRKLKIPLTPAPDVTVSEPEAAHRGRPKNSKTTSTSLSTLEVKNLLPDFRQFINGTQKQRH